MTTTYPVNAISNGKKPVWPLDEGDPLLDYLKSLLRLRPRGLCTDIDGTISETAPTVDAAVLLPGMHDLLRDLSECFDLTATISGRGVEDQRRMIGIPNVWHVGHHGYEWEELEPTTGVRRPFLWPAAVSYLDKIAAALDEIEAELAPRVPGLWMERKGITGGVHWRLAEDQERAEQIASPIIRRIALAYGLHQSRGKLAIELLPPVPTNKGEGLHRLIKRHQLGSVLYLGDDVSDADAFSIIHSLRKRGICKGLGIGVLHSNTPTAVFETADLFVEGTAGAQDFLMYLRDNG